MSSKQKIELAVIEESAKNFILRRKIGHIIADLQDEMAECLGEIREAFGHPCIVRTCPECDGVGAMSGAHTHEIIACLRCGGIGRVAA